MLANPERRFLWRSLLVAIVTLSLETPFNDFDNH
jgi:hypothetical protein